MLSVHTFIGISHYLPDSLYRFIMNSINVDHKKIIHERIKSRYGEDIYNMIRSDPLDWYNNSVECGIIENVYSSNKYSDTLYFDTINSLLYGCITRFNDICVYYILSRYDKRIHCEIALDIALRYNNTYAFELILKHGIINIHAPIVSYSINHTAHTCTPKTRELLIEYIKQHSI